MSQTYDVILEVRHRREPRRRRRARHRRARRAYSRARRPCVGLHRRRNHRRHRASPSSPGLSIHRCISVSRSRAQGGSRNRLTCRGAGWRHRRLRNAQHQPDRPPAKRRSTTSFPRTQSHACRSRLLGRRLRDNVDHLPELERLPGGPASRPSWAPPPARCWCRTTRARASSSPSRRRAAFHAEDDYRLDERRNAPRRRFARSSGRDATRPWPPRRAAAGHARAGTERVHVLHVSSADEMALLRHPRTWRLSRRCRTTLRSSRRRFICASASR